MSNIGAMAKISGRWCAMLASGLLATAATAQTYSVKINPTLHDLDIKIEPIEMVGLLVIKLTNGSDTKVRCDLVYDAAPQTLYRTTTFVDPGKTEQSTFQARQTWFSVDVSVECNAAEKK